MSIFFFVHLLVATASSGRHMHGTPRAEEERDTAIDMDHTQEGISHSCQSVGRAEGKQERKTLLDSLSHVQLGVGGLIDLHMIVSILIAVAHYQMLPL
jgi:hypothetical protein